MIEYMVKRKKSKLHVMNGYTIVIAVVVTEKRYCLMSEQFNHADIQVSYHLPICKFCCVIINNLCFYFV